MPKALCLISLVASILVVVLFLADMVLGLLGMQDLAPLSSAKPWMDVVFIVAGGVLIFMSWTTYREQR
jgi:arginine exporter protein ArgO